MMKNYKDMIQEDIDWLFQMYLLDKCEITKSVERGGEWDYVVKLKMGGMKNE